MKQILLPVVVACLFFPGCAVLTTRQMDAVNQFARTSNNFSAYPSRIITALAELRVKRGIYFANSVHDPQTHLTELDNLYSAMISDFAVSAKADISFRVIDKYAVALLLLSSPAHAANFDSQALRTGHSLESLLSTYNQIPGVKPVPTGMGSLTGSLLQAGGDQIIRRKQAKALQEFVPAADTIMRVMIGNLLDYLENTNIDFLISNEERSLASNYRSFLNQRTPLVGNDRDYLDMKQDLDGIKALRSATIIAANQILKTHASLLAALEKPDDLNETVAALQSMYDNVNAVKTAYGKISAVQK